MSSNFLQKVTKSDIKDADMSVLDASEGRG